MKNYTQAHWNKAEDEILSSSIMDGMKLEVLEKKLPNRSPSAISRRVQKYNYGVKTVQGVKVLYYGKKTRNRKKKADDILVSDEATDTIVGEKRNATNISAPTTSESTNQNLSDVSIHYFDNISNRDVLMSLYDDVSKLLNCERYSNLKSIIVSLEDITISVSKGSS